MRDILIGKVETDPLIHYGGIFNNIETMLLLSLLLFISFIPFIKDGKWRNFLFYTSSLMPILNIYYRNNHSFVGGVFLGHLFFIIGIILISYLGYVGFEKAEIKNRFFVNKRLLLITILILLIVRSILVFGSRPTDSGIFSGIGGILYFTGSSMFRDYWGVVSIGSRYGPMLYLAYLPFVPIAYITKHFLWGDALTLWNSVSDVPLAVATSYTGAIFYEGLIIYILIKSFKRYGYIAAILYLLTPLNNLILSVNANELPQTALFLLGIYVLKKPVLSSILFVSSSLMKIYPIVIAPVFLFVYEKKKRIYYLVSLILFFIVGFLYWLYEASLAPPDLKTNPIRDTLIYQNDPGQYHSLWYFIDIILGKHFSFSIIGIIILITIVAIIYLFLKKRLKSLYPVKLSILVLSMIIITNRSPHPGYYYFIHTLLLYLFFSFQEYEEKPLKPDTEFTCV